MKKRRRTPRTGIQNTVAGLAWYRPEQWHRLLEVSEDSDNMESEFEEWRKSAEKAIVNFTAAGVQVRKVDIDVEELVEWCRDNGLPVNIKARSHYAAEKVRQQSMRERGPGDA
jgi:hypothetical protein